MKTTTEEAQRSRRCHRSQRGKSTPALTTVLLLAAIAPHAATALSLSNFQLITSSSVPINCLLAYNTQLAGCTISDFTQLTSAARQRLRRGVDDTNTCSLACQAGISLAQQTIQTVCGASGISARAGTGPATSVLGVALTGNLVGLLCGGSETVSTSTTSTTEALQTASTSVTAGAAVATTATAPFVFSTLDPAGVELTSTTGVVAQAPAAGAATATPGLDSQSFVQSASSSVAVTVSLSNSPGNAAPPSPPVMTAPLPPARQTLSSTSTTSSSSSSTTTASAANNRNIFGGGGSPFDEAAANSGAERAGQLVSPWTQPWMMFAAAGAAGAAAAGGVLFR
ncbi:hypothetical protein SBRCBS47491_002897 [Sporothrix bragantina]|uniref:Uncharacterized protein n=1 Tax=Sporothrix bragantina TaxID=671064 RepID=A0ABP0BBP0_9PEZI